LELHESVRGEAQDASLVLTGHADIVHLRKVV